jgi:preprotein translocase subunit YajC
MLWAVLLADDAPAKQEPPGTLSMFFPLIIIGIFLITMMWLPARRQKKEQELMLTSLKRGAKVVTVAGIVGTIVTIKDGEEELVLRSEDTKLKVTRASIARVLGQEDEPKT